MTKYKTYYFIDGDGNKQYLIGDNPSEQESAKKLLEFLGDSEGIAIEIGVGYLTNGEFKLFNLSPDTIIESK